MQKEMLLENRVEDADLIRDVSDIHPDTPVKNNGDNLNKEYLSHYANAVRLRITDFLPGGYQSYMERAGYFTNREPVVRKNDPIKGEPSEDNQVRLIPPTSKIEILKVYHALSYPSGLALAIGTLIEISKIIERYLL